MAININGKNKLEGVNELVWNNEGKRPAIIAERNAACLLLVILSIVTKAIGTKSDRRRLGRTFATNSKGKMNANIAAR